MVSFAEGRRRSQELGCIAFHEISVRENVDQVSFFFQTSSMSYIITFLNHPYSGVNKSDDRLFVTESMSSIDLHNSSFMNT